MKAAHAGPAGRAGRAGRGAEDAGPDLAVLLHPRLPELYRRKVEQLERVLEGANRAEAHGLDPLHDRAGRVAAA